MAGTSLRPAPTRGGHLATSGRSRGPAPATAAMPPPPTCSCPYLAGHLPTLPNRGLLILPPKPLFKRGPSTLSPLPPSNSSPPSSSTVTPLPSGSLCLLRPPSSPSPAPQPEQSCTDPRSTTRPSLKPLPSPLCSWQKSEILNACADVSPSPAGIHPFSPPIPPFLLVPQAALPGRGALTWEALSPSWPP